MQAIPKRLLCYAAESDATGLMGLFVAKYCCPTKLLCPGPTGEFSLDDSKRLCVLTLEKALKQLPEGQDTVLGIFDLRGFKQKNGDLGFAGFLVSGISPSRQSTIVVHECSAPNLNPCGVHSQPCKFGYVC